MPTDAEKDDETRWILSSRITTHLRRNPARNILIVADSCYSGTLTRTRKGNGINLTGKRRKNYLKKMLQKRSRILIASGGNEPVLDGGGEGHSIFAQAFLDGLRDIEKNAFTAEELFTGHIIEPVAGMVEQTPEHQVIRRSGHRGGNFVFQRR